MLQYDLIKNLIPMQSCTKKRDNKDFLIVMNENGEIFYLNDSAKLVYSLCNSKHSVDEILMCMINKYEATSDDLPNLMNDLLEILRDFQWQKTIKLIERS